VSTSASADIASGEVSGGFRHEALLYAGEGDFVRWTSSFIRDGIEAGEPILVIVGAEKIADLRDELGPQSNGILFADMADVGGNPARIIPLWRAFVDEHGPVERPLRGIGEPIWAARGPAELVECERHKARLNLAFADARAFRRCVLTTPGRSRHRSWKRRSGTTRSCWRAADIVERSSSAHCGRSRNRSTPLCRSRPREPKRHGSR
jgi:DcmR-like sensory protein